MSYDDENTNDDKDLLTRAKEDFKKADEVESQNREDASDDIAFARLSEQWPEQIKRQRELEGRPCLTINKMPAFIRQVVNDARLNKPAISIHPVDDNADVETAKVLQGIIRNIEVTSNAEAAYDTGLDSAVTSGFGFWRVDYDYTRNDTFELDLKIERIANQFTVYGDPASQAVDGSDWNVAFVTEIMEKEEFKKAYPDAEMTDWETDYEDMKDDQWYMEDSIRVAEYWTREEEEVELLRLTDGQVMYQDVYEKHKDLYDMEGVTVQDTRTTKRFKVMMHVVTGAEVLSSEEWKGQYIPIVPVYGEEVNYEGKRYFRSLIRDAKDSQRNFNYWRTSATELVALAPKAPWVGPQGAFDTDSEKWQTANTVNHATLEYDGDIPPQRQPFAGVPAGALQEALNSSDDMKGVMGLYDASMGARSNETSGKAILARQREGDVSTFHFIDNLSRAIRYTGLILVDLIPHIYTEERIARVLGEDDSPDTVPINQEYPVIENGQPKLDEMGEPVTRINDLTTGKYDVTVSSGPSFSTRREEARESMMGLVQAFPQAAPIIGDLLAKNFDWPMADEIAARLKAMLPTEIKQLEGKENPEAAALQVQIDQMNQQAQQAIQQVQGQIQQLEQENETLKADKSIEAEKARAEIQFKMEELELRKVDMQLKAQAAMKPEAPQHDGDNITKLTIEREKMAFEAEQNALNRQADLAKLIIQKDSEEPTEDAAGLAMQQAAALMAAPKVVVRDENGQVVGVETVTNG